MALSGRTPLQERARQYLEQKEFAQALPLYEQLSQGPNPNRWDLYYLARCLYKTNRYSEARDICRSIWAKFSDPRPEALRNLASWCVYHCELKPLSVGNTESEGDLESGERAGANSKRLQEAEEAASTICKMTAQGQGSPFTKAVLTISKMFKQGSTNWDKVLDWTSRLDMALLSREPWKPEIPDSSGKTREDASELEKWYCYRSKALLKTGRYADCVSLCEEYEASGLKPHYDWDSWIPFYRAQALHELHRMEEAHAAVDKALLRNRAPAILRFKAMLLLDEGKIEDAWKTALDGALEMPESKNDSQLIGLLAKLARERGEQEVSRQHYELLLSIRSSQDWKVPEQLRLEAESVGAVLSGTSTVAETERQFKRLCRWWWNELVHAEPRSQGKIESLNGHSGFIRMGNGEAVYCRNLKGMSSGMRVSFWIRESWDRKKRCPSSAAIRLRKE